MHAHEKQFLTQTYQNLLVLFLWLHIHAPNYAVVGIGEEKKFRNEGRNAFAIFLSASKSGSTSAESAGRTFGVVRGDANVIAAAAIFAAAWVDGVVGKRRLHLKSVLKYAS